MGTQVGRPVQKLLPILFQLILLLALGVSSAAADRKERKSEPLPKPPPQPVEQTVKVRRGERVIIPLRIYGSQRESLRFLIRKEPVSGKLSEPVSRDRESALVSYEPPADLNVTRDQFSYATQSSAGVSAAADVRITIVDDPPVLVIPDTVKFPTLLAGQSNAQEIEISNRGGGVAAGELQVEAPWRIEGSTEYRLGAGEIQKVKIVFEPLIAGPYRGELQFRGEQMQTRAIALQGEALAALAAVPPTVVLQSQAGEVFRTGAFELVNGTSEPQTVSFAQNSKLTIPKTVELPPNGKAVVAIHTGSDNVAAIEEELVAKGAGVELRIAVNSPAVGPVLRSLGEKLVFGEITPGSGGIGVIEVQNVGGAEGYWRWETVPPFTPEEEGFKLAAGEKRTVSVRLSPDASGQYRAALRLVGEQQKVEVLAEVNVAAGSKPVASQPRTTTFSPKATVRRVGVQTRSRAAEPEDTEPPGIPLLPSEIRSLENKRAVVVWPTKGYEGNYRLESRSLGLDSDRKLKIEWSVVSSAKVSAEGETIVAEIDGLAPNSTYAFRLVNIPPGSDVGTPVGLVQFRTPLKEPLVRFTWLRGLFLLLAVFLAALAVRRLRH